MHDLLQMQFVGAFEGAAEAGDQSIDVIDQAPEFVLSVMLRGWQRLAARGVERVQLVRKSFDRADDKERDDQRDDADDDASQADENQRDLTHGCIDMGIDFVPVWHQCHRADPFGGIERRIDGALKRRPAVAFQAICALALRFRQWPVECRDGHLHHIAVLDKGLGRFLGQGGVFGEAGDARHRAH